jgi:hypothetical protein
MAITPQTRSKLSDLIEDRRLDMGLTLRQVAQAAGIAYESIRTLRSPDAGAPRPLTMRGVDQALMWKSGSVRRVLYDGGDPDPLPLPERAMPESLRRLLGGGQDTAGSSGA